MSNVPQEERKQPLRDARRRVLAIIQDTSELPEGLRWLPGRLIEDLFRSRVEGRSNPDNPVLASTICKAYKQLYTQEITSRDIRTVVAWAVTKGVPIGSVNNGYFWVMSPEEWETVMAFYMTYVDRFRERYDEAKKMQASMREHENYEAGDLFGCLKALLDIVPTPYIYE